MAWVVFASLTYGSAQTSTANYALPASASGVEAVVSNVPGYMLTLSEGGEVQGDAKSTCDGQVNGVFKSTVGVVLQHYYDKTVMSQTAVAYASLGGLKGVFKQSVEGEYNDLENDVNVSRLGGFVKKGKLVTEQSGDAQVMYYTLTHNCVENANPTATKIVYHVMLLTDENYVLITNEIYSQGIEQAKKYAEESLSRIKGLDYGAVK
jgi:hypothetical protein